MQRLCKFKHIGANYHYEGDAVDSETVQLTHTPSSENHAGSLTKVLVGDD